MAKLVLYSDQIIEENKKVDEELLKLFDKSNPSIAYIPSCSDPSRKYFNQKVEYYKSMGIEDLQYFDLDKEYDEEKINNVFKYDAIHLSGGNTFYFLYLLRKRDFIELLRDYVKKGGILIGISAGSILMTNTITIAGLGEDADENIVGLEDKKALGIVDFEFSPHWNGDSEKLELIRGYAKETNIKIYVCKDGAGIVINSDNVQLIGEIEEI